MYIYIFDIIINNNLLYSLILKNIKKRFHMPDLVVNQLRIPIYMLPIYRVQSPMMNWIKSLVNMVTLYKRIYSEIS